VMLILAALPGIPMLPFLALGGGAAYLAWTSDKRKRKKAAVEAKAAAEAPEAAAAAAQAAAEEPIANALKIDDLKIELGYALLPLVNAPDGTDRPPSRSRRCAVRSQSRWASSCRRCASSTTCSLKPTPTSSRSRRSTQGKGASGRRTTWSWIRWAVR
jgi:hypothetical protein